MQFIFGEEIQGFNLKFATSCCGAPSSQARRCQFYLHSTFINRHSITTLKRPGLLGRAARRRGVVSEEIFLFPN